MGLGRIVSIFLMLAVMAVALPAQAAKRIALMIGNGDYTAVGNLDNPVNDATDIGKALEAVGFTVQYKFDLGREDIVRALSEFRREAQGAEAAIIYYAGHGIEVDKQNFMIPVDARLQSADDVEFEAVNLDLFMRSVGGARELKLVILDACRNNPFQGVSRSSVRNRNIGRGLRAVEPVGNTLVAYAAREGTLASDGTGRNSPYAEALIKALNTDGLEIGKFFRQVRDDVLAATGNAQEPFYYGSLSAEDFFFRTPTDGPEPPKTGGETDPTVDPPRDNGADRSIELAFWKSVEKAGTKDAYEVYLKTYPQGKFVPLARLRVEALAPPVEDTVNRDLALWQSVDQEGSKNGYEAYLQSFPDGQFAALARQRLAALEPIDKDPDPPIIDRDPPPTSRKVFDTREGYHIIGMDLIGAERLGVSFQACSEYCAALDQCQSFSYNHRRRGCYPKTGITKIERFAGVTSGAVNELNDRLFARAAPDPGRGGGDNNNDGGRRGRGVERNTDFPGRDLKSYGNGVRGVSLARCRTICTNDRRCRAYTYVPDSNWCFPKSSVSRRRTERRAISEVVR